MNPDVKVVELLIQHLTYERRDSIIDRAYHESKLRGIINRTGGDKVFAHHVVNECHRFGNIDGKPAIIPLLSELKEWVGTETQKDIDDLIEELIGNDDGIALALSAHNRRRIRPAIVTLLIFLVGVGVVALLPIPTRIQYFATDVPPSETVSPVQTYITLGMGYSEDGDYDLAIENFNRAIELAPDNIDAYIQRGNTYRNSEAYNSAIADYNSVIELDPEFAAAYYLRGLAHRSTGEYEDAIASFTQAIELDPELSAAYYNRGLAYRDMGNNERAIASFTQAVELGQQDIRVYYNRGLAYFELEEYAAAVRDFERTIELDPGYLFAQDMLEAAIAARDGDS